MRVHPLFDVARLPDVPDILRISFCVDRVDVPAREEDRLIQKILKLIVGHTCIV